MRNLSLALLCVPGFLVTAIWSGPVIRADERPNIVVILCDDLGYGDLGIQGHPHLKTEHLDRLANEGIRFTQFYSAAPVCSPSRVGLMTGRSPNRAGVYDWIPESRKLATDARDLVHLRRSEITLPQLLRQAGYSTCMAGKWHCNSRFNSPEQPQPGDAGFDHWLATQNNAAPTHENPTNYVRNGQPVGKLEGYSCQLAIDEAISWLEGRQAQQSSNPFFVYLPFHEPHEPVASPPELVEKYRSVVFHEDQAQYFANVHNVDLAVGRFVAALEKMSLRKNTLIVFSSDNGPETLNRYKTASRSWGRTGILRGVKLHTHDGGFHVAGIANWPAKIKPAQTIHTPVSSLDLLPTLCELGGAPLPSNRVLDGISLVSLLSGDGIPERQRPLIWAYYNAINDARVAMRHGPWKVLARLNGGQLPRFENLTPERLATVQAAELTDFEIYNVTNDPGETLNLADRGLKKTDELKTLLVNEYRALAGDSLAWTREPEQPKP
jgi:arylsulfatase A